MSGLNNDRWYESLGDAVNTLAQHYMPAVEKGRAIEHIYNRMMKEAERDAREEKNK